VSTQIRPLCIVLYHSLYLVPLSCSLCVVPLSSSLCIVPLQVLSVLSHSQVLFVLYPSKFSLYCPTLKFSLSCPTLRFRQILLEVVCRRRLKITIQAAKEDSTARQHSGGQPSMLYPLSPSVASKFGNHVSTV